MTLDAVDAHGSAICRVFEFGRTHLRRIPEFSGMFFAVDVNILQGVRLQSNDIKYQKGD